MKPGWGKKTDRLGGNGGGGVKGRRNSLRSKSKGSDNTEGSHFAVTDCF